MRFLARRALYFLAVLLPLAVPAFASAASRTVTVRPARVSTHAAAFRVGQLRSLSVLRASVVADGRGRPVGVKRLRAATQRGTLRVPTLRRYRRVRLQVRVAVPASAHTHGTRPYAAASPFNRVIPAGSPDVSNSAKTVSRVMGFGGLEDLDVYTNDGDRSGQPFYYSKASDPMFTLHCTQAWGNCEIEGMQVRIPAGARPEGPTDAHLTVIDQATGWEYDLWEFGATAVPANGGRLDFGWGGRTRVGTDGDGLGSDSTAAHFGNLAGVIRPQELAAGKINHALFMIVKCDSGRYVYPAQAGGRHCADIGLSNTDAPDMGARFQLDLTDPQIQALNEPAWKKTILTAMAHYGLIVGDTGGTWGLKKESGRSYTSFNSPNPWVALAQQHNISYYQPDNSYVFRMKDATIDSLLANNLHVVAPCTSQGTC